MSDYLWRKCPHCGASKYCTDKVMLIHEEDCHMRPSLRSRMKICSKCSSAMQRVQDTWYCVNADCDFKLDVLPGGKLP